MGFRSLTMWIVFSRAEKCTTDRIGDVFHCRPNHSFCDISSVTLLQYLDQALTSVFSGCSGQPTSILKPMLLFDVTREPWLTSTLSGNYKRSTDKAKYVCFYAMPCKSEGIQHRLLLCHLEITSMDKVNKVRSYAFSLVFVHLPIIALKNKRDLNGREPKGHAQM